MVWLDVLIKQKITHFSSANIMLAFWLQLIFLETAAYVKTVPEFEEALAAAEHLIPSMPGMAQYKCAVSFPIRKVHKIPAAWRFVTSCCAVHNEPVATLVDGIAGLLQSELFEYAAV
jgi:hypothetical protein